MNLINLSNRILEFYNNSAAVDLKPQLTPKKLSDLLDLELTEHPSTSDDLEKFIGQYLDHSVNTHNKKFANQLWSKTGPYSILGELLSAVTNTSMYTYEVAPVATLMEQKMIEHLSTYIWGKSTDGIMTSGGSASNLHALMIARNTRISEAKNSGLKDFKSTPVIFAAKNAHYSIKRAINILGLGQNNLIEIETDLNGSMSTQDLKNKLQMTKEKGLFPLAVVSTAGTTVEGSYDDLTTIASICKEQDLWLHVDGAYGGSALLSKKHSELLTGLEHADSFSWDFHKMLGINLPCAFLLIKHKGLLKQTLSSGNDSYLFHDDEDASIDLGPKSLQCGRKNDILKLWLTWMAIGRKGFEERVNKLFELSQNFSEIIKSNKELTLIKEPQSINVCFRFNSSERIEDKIRQKMVERGHFLINYSTDNDGPFFRLAITRPDLTHQDFTELTDLIIRTGHELC